MWPQRRSNVSWVSKKPFRTVVCIEHLLALISDSELSYNCGLFSFKRSVIGMTWMCRVSELEEICNFKSGRLILRHSSLCGLTSLSSQPPTTAFCMGQYKI